jgi:hypothetical protein
MVNLWIATRTGSQESRQSVATAGAALKSLQVNRQANETGGRVVGLLVPRQKKTHTHTHTRGAKNAGGMFRNLL